jgi:hypothetical protein
MNFRVLDAGVQMNQRDFVLKACSLLNRGQLLDNPSARDDVLLESAKVCVWEDEVATASPVAKFD